MGEQTVEQLQEELNTTHELYQGMILNFKRQLADMAESSALEMAKKDRNIRELTQAIQELEKRIESKGGDEQ